MHAFAFGESFLPEADEEGDAEARAVKNCGSDSPIAPRLPTLSHSRRVSLSHKVVPRC
jgi:hypothetical protein